MGKRVTTGVCDFKDCRNLKAYVRTGLCHGHQTQWRRGEELRYIPQRWETRKITVKICKHEGCESHVRSAGYCGRHYRQQWRYGTTHGEGSPITCSVNRCVRPEAARGYCELHYNENRGGWIPRGTTVPCGIPYCEKSGYSGLCDKHGLRARRFNLTHRDLIALLSRDKCDACGRLGEDLNIHHDHRCCNTGGKSCGRCVAAYLCRQCNSAAGMAGDNPDVLRRLADIMENPTFTPSPKAGV